MRLSIPCLLLLAACGREHGPAPIANEAPAPASGDGADSTTPVADGDQPDLKSPAAAADVLRRYFSLVEAGRHDDAEDLWWDEGRATAFAARLRGIGDFRPNIAAPGRVEGAAGSAYITVSLQLLRGGRSLSDGTAVLRRVNDVPGSSAEQRRWRIDRINLQPPPQPITHRFVGRWASDERNCANRAWVFTADSLRTPAGSVCEFRRVRQVPGGYDVAANCTAEGPPADDTLRLRFAESARALLFESDVIADAGLVRCR